MKADRYQSVEMACGIKIATALVLFLAFANAGPSPFPRDRNLVYSYYGDVKAGIIEPAAYASQYAISGYFNVKSDNSDSEYPNAFIAGLTNVKTGLHNGLAAHYQRTKIFSPLPEPAKVLEDPFLMIYSEDGQLAGVKISTDEPGWSKNMKLAIASMLQLDLPSMRLDSPMKHQSFMSKENTIHGDCWTSYDVYAKSPEANKESNEFTITKFSSPRNCTKYNVFTFNHAEFEGCDLPPEKPVNMASRKVFQAEKRGEDILINSLIAHGGVNYFPWRGRSEAHYVLNNATFVLLENESLDNSLPVVDFAKLPLITDISYQRPESNYAEKAGIDITQGRHTVDQDSLIPKVKEMLGEAADYLEENHLAAKEPDFKRGHTINRLVHEMSFMSVPSLRQVFSEIRFAKTPRYQVIKNIFLEVIPHVGTHASSLFILNLIANGDVDHLSAIQMLIKFPLNVRNPTEKLVEEMDDLMKVISKVHTSVIPNVASLVFRVFKNAPEPEKNFALNHFIDTIYEMVINMDYSNKVTGLAALKNVQLNRIFELLAPLVRSDVEVHRLDDEDSKTNLRLHAIWAVEKSIPNYHAAHDLLWPIMADSSAPLKLRTAAYDILIRQAPYMTNILHIYWFMVYEKNEHLYNYHYTTIKGLANSVDSCNMHIKELATKIMRFTKIHAPVSYALSGSHMVDAVDEIYGHGDQFAISYTLHEATGMPDVVTIEYSTIEGRRRIALWKIQLIVDSIDLQQSSLLSTFIEERSMSISSEDVKQILQQASEAMKSQNIYLDAVISHKGRVVFANSYRGRELLLLLADLEPLIKFENKIIKVNRQFIFYDAMYEQHVISEMGLPVFMESKIPAVTSFKGEFERQPSGQSMRFRKNIDYRGWRHGDYAMSIYNPLLDVWHTIRKSTATDVQLPMESLSSFTSDGPTLEIITPRLPMTKYSIQGMVTHAKDCTTVTEDDNGTLKKACPTCEYHEVVTKGISAKKNYQTAYDIQDVGLEYSGEIFDCETDVTPVLIKKNVFRSFYNERKNSWGNELINEFLAFRQSCKNLIHSPRMGSCGVMYRVQPSAKYPTSYVQTSLKVNAENRDQNDGILHMLSEFKLNVRGKLKAVALTNETTCTWRIGVDVGMSREHRLNTMSVQLTRSRPNEKNLLVCIDGQKSYPSIPNDPLRVGVTKEETHGKMTFSMAESDGAECTRDQTLITIGVKGELSEEQKKWFIQESISGACKADMDNPLYNNAENLVPRTVNCLDHAIKYTTLRKYTIDVAHANVPQSVSSVFHAYEDEIKALFYPHLVYTSEHTEPGTMRMIVKFLMKLNNVNVSVITTDHSWNVIGAEVSENSWTATERDPPRHEGFGPDPDKHLWMAPLDNSRFPIGFLYDYADDEMKLCSLYSKVVLTTDGGEIPYVIPEEWTLASGDTVYKTWAIFVKSVNNVMGVKLFARDNVVEISPKGSLIINNDEVAISRMINGTYVPKGEQNAWSFRLTSYGGVHAIEVRNAPVTVIHSLNGVTLMMDHKLQGLVAGLCGSMDGTHKTKLPKSYRLR